MHEEMSFNLYFERELYSLDLTMVWELVAYLIFLAVVGLALGILDLPGFTRANKVANETSVTKKKNPTE